MTVYIEAKQKFMNDQPYLIPPLGGFCPLCSTNVVADIIIGATVDKHLSALVEYYPCWGGVLLHPVAQKLKINVHIKLNVYTVSEGFSGYVLG